SLWRQLTFRPQQTCGAPDVGGHGADRLRSVRPYTDRVSEPGRPARRGLRQSGHLHTTSQRKRPSAALLKKPQIAGIATHDEQLRGQVATTTPAFHARQHRALELRFARIALPAGYWAGDVAGERRS